MQVCATISCSCFAGDLTQAFLTAGQVPYSLSCSRTPPPKLVEMQTPQELMVQLDGLLRVMQIRFRAPPLGFLGLGLGRWWSGWVVGVWKGVGASRESTDLHLRPCDKGGVRKRVPHSPGGRVFQVEWEADTKAELGAKRQKPWSLSSVFFLCLHIAHHDLLMPAALSFGGRESL